VGHSALVIDGSTGPDRERRPATAYEPSHRSHLGGPSQLEETCTVGSEVRAQGIERRSHQVETVATSIDRQQRIGGESADVVAAQIRRVGEDERKALVLRERVLDARLANLDTLGDTGSLCILNGEARCDCVGFDLHERPAGEHGRKEADLSDTGEEFEDRARRKPGRHLGGPFALHDRPRAWPQDSIVEGDGQRTECEESRTAGLDG
jgi:hypothetical protein